MDIEQLEQRVSESIAAGDLPRAIGLLEASVDADLDDPAAFGWLWHEVADEYAARHRYDEAIATMQRCIELGDPADFDGRVAVAGYLQQAGRDAEADQLWATVRGDTPDDAWLYSSAGWACLEAKRYEEALSWLDQGMELALRTGDPQGVMDQLLEARSETLDALEREPDELQERGESFFAAVLRQRPVGAQVPVSDEYSDTFAVAWFPPGEFDEALRRWPDLIEGDDTDYRAYVGELQQLLAGAREDGTPLFVAPLHVEAYLAWCEAQDVAPDSEVSRDDYAVVIADLGGAQPWPPGRNDPCWCASGLKYKKCCARVA